MAWEVLTLYPFELRIFDQLAEGREVCRVNRIGNVITVWVGTPTNERDETGARLAQWKHIEKLVFDGPYEPMRVLRNTEVWSAR